MALVAQRGDKDAGAVFVRVNRLDGTSDLLSAMTDMDGARLWRYLLPAASPNADIEARIAQECGYDSDAWVVEIEDRQARHFIEEKVTTV